MQPQWQYLNICKIHDSFPNLIANLAEQFLQIEIKF